MKEYIFDEKKTIEHIINNKIVDEININKTIKKIARYNYFIKQINSDDNYANIVQYMKENCPDFVEIGHYSDIKGCIRDASKSPWKNVNKVVITKHELEIISALNDIRQEKIAFVLLADAKYDNAYKGSNINLSYISVSDLYRLARVTMPIKDRNMFLNFLYDKGLVEININPTKTHKKLLYVDKTDDDVALVLSENNYKELAFTYLNWKNGGGYKECKSCGSLFKTKKTGNQEYCKKCTPEYKKIEFKTVVCVDCGVEAIVDAKDNKTCRCEECQHKALKESWKKASQKYRDSKRSS